MLHTTWGYHSRLKSVVSSITHNTKKACFVIKTYGVCPNIGGIQTYGGVQEINKAVLHTTQRKHALSSKYTGRCPNLWGVSTYGAFKHVDASKHIGVSQTYRGIQTYGGCSNIQGASKHMGVIKHSGGLCKTPTLDGVCRMFSLKYFCNFDWQM